MTRFERSDGADGAKVGRLNGTTVLVEAGPGQKMWERVARKIVITMPSADRSRAIHLNRLLANAHLAHKHPAYRKELAEIEARTAKPSGEVRWLVAELGGVRLYTDGRVFVMTKRDLWP